MENEKFNKINDVINLACNLLRKNKHYDIRLLNLLIDDNPKKDADGKEYGETIGQAYIAEVQYPTGKVRKLRFLDLYLTEPGMIPWTGEPEYYNNKQIDALPLDKRVLLAVALYLYCEGTRR